jgi:hypothetical protein|tara:strand:+ start:10345 stop:10821 length:477 start_codon:yes stop_codon:yes gene_type:complete
VNDKDITTDQERTDRSTETRDQDERNESWQPPSILPDPKPIAGYTFRWIRTSMIGHADNTNVSMKFREGWVPVRAEDHPELHVMTDHDSKFKGNIEIGGLLLCKAPEETAKARQRHYEELASQQMESVDRTYMRENDPRMPVLKPDRTTRTTFGRGGS